MLLGLPNDRQFLALARWRLGHLFPYLPKQPGYNKRVRRLGPQIARAITHLAHDLAVVRRQPAPAGLHAGPVRPVARDRQAQRAGRQRRLRLLRQPQPLLLGLSALPAVRPGRHAGPLRAVRGQRSASATPPARCSNGLDLDGYTVLADKGFAGEEFETFMADLDANFVRPDRKNEPVRYGALGADPAMDRVGLLDLQGPADARAPRRAHPHRPGRPRRPAAARAGRRPRGTTNSIDQPGRHLALYSH